MLSRREQQKEARKGVYMRLLGVTTCRSCGVLYERNGPVRGCLDGKPFSLEESELVLAGIGGLCKRCLYEALAEMTSGE